ncbi:hypothetical protein Poli38472_004133 [Pythium oligandrum]|uniref:Uncharacterized protein n=1 Tax=Pythium oligandrum TaxID=41045 RepID=A0A8K1CQ71_PYTOL|nr:hypothetical protein Poli38472_004133 [Pythium oligandrum]|eukprot:TMW66368.1 hypothetical protein Poli38472_004133 [Pythium oligandrum]
MVRLLLAGVAFAALMTRDSVDAVKACAECPAGKTCLLENVADAIPAGQSSMNLKFCNFDKAQTYTLSFSLKFPLQCDPDMKAMPKLKSLEPQDGCAPDNCIVKANFESSIDWAIAMKNAADLNALSAKITSSTGQDESVLVANGVAADGAAVVGGSADARPTVCSTEFVVSGSRLSGVKECNVAQICRGKSADTACPGAPLATNLLVDDVKCQGESCTGTVALTTPLPCDAATGEQNALILGLKVGNSAASNFANIATLAGATAAKVSGIDGADSGSSTLVIAADGVCQDPKVSIGGIVVKSATPANGSIEVTLEEPLSNSISGKNLNISLTQCGQASSPFIVKIDGGNASDSDDDDNDSDSVGNSTKAPGSKSTESNQKTDSEPGLPGGLYIGIGVGVIAFCGFIFECWYHKRRQAKPDNGAPAVNGYTNAVV